MVSDATFLFLILTMDVLCHFLSPVYPYPHLTNPSDYEWYKLLHLSSFCGISLALLTQILHWYLVPPLDVSSNEQRDEDASASISMILPDVGIHMDQCKEV